MYCICVYVFVLIYKYFRNHSINMYRTCAHAAGWRWRSAGFRAKRSQNRKEKIYHIDGCVCLCLCLHANESVDWYGWCACLLGEHLCSIRFYSSSHWLTGIRENALLRMLRNSRAMLADAAGRISCTSSLALVFRNWLIASPAKQTKPKSMEDAV